MPKLRLLDVSPAISVPGVGVRGWLTFWEFGKGGGLGFRVDLLFRFLGGGRRGLRVWGCECRLQRWEFGACRLS